MSRQMSSHGVWSLTKSYFKHSGSQCDSPIVCLKDKEQHIYMYTYVSGFPTPNECDVNACMFDEVYAHV